jgi:hypothetical protein
VISEERAAMAAAPRTLAALLVVALASCGPGARSDDGVELRISTGALAVARVVATISAGAGGPFEPIVAHPDFDGARWTLSVNGVPAGSQRQFDVVAYDGAGAVAASGSARADVAPGGRSLVVLLLQTPAAPPVMNSAPVVDALWASPGGVPAGGAARVGASAHDPNSGDAVSFRWDASCGTVDDPTLAETTWRAPDVSGASCALSITVSDAAAASVTTWFALSTQ